MSMKNKTVVFDCDDVLANLREPLQVLVSKYLGYNVSWEHWNRYEIGKIYNFDFNHICDKIVEEDTLSTLSPEPFAKELIEWYKQQNIHTIVLTARGYHKEGRTITERWLKTNDLYIDEVICCDPLISKREYLRYIPNIVDYVEDNHHNAEQACGLTNVHNVYLLNRPWNVDIESEAVRVNDLETILKYKSI